MFLKILSKIMSIVNTNQTTLLAENHQKTLDTIVLYIFAYYYDTAHFEVTAVDVGRKYIVTRPMVLIIYKTANT